MDFEENLLSPKYIAYSWGKNEAGELSHGNTKMALLPREVKGCTRKPRQISSAKSSSALVNSEGCLFLTGSTLLGKLGFKQSSQYFVTKFEMMPSKVFSLDEVRVKQVVCGDFHTLCLLEDRRVFSWGGTLHGKVGQRSGVPSQIRSLSSKNIKYIDCGDFHTVALSEKGQLFSWGGGGNHKNKGQLGHGKLVEDVELPKLVSFFEGRRVKMVKCGGYHTLAVTQNEQLFSWGQNSYGQCGYGEFVDSDKPKQIYLRLNKNILAEEYFNDFGIKFLVKQLEGGGRFSLVLTTSGHLFSFGYGSGGQLGLGHSDNVAQPTLVTSLLGKRVVRVAAGWSHSLVLTDNKDVYACGYGKHGQLGVGDEKSRTNFTHVRELAGKNVNQIYAGGNSSWAVLDEMQPQIRGYQPPSPLRIAKQDDTRSGILDISKDVSKYDRNSSISQPAPQSHGTFESSLCYTSDTCLQAFFTEIQNYHRLVYLYFKEDITESVRYSIEEFINASIATEKVLHHKTQFDGKLFDSAGRVLNEREYRRCATFMIIVAPYVRLWADKQKYQVDRTELLSVDSGEMLKVKASQIAEHSWQSANSKWFIRLLEKFESRCQKLRVIELRPRRLLF